MDTIKIRKMRKLESKVAGIFYISLLICMILIVGESDREVVEAQRLTYYYP